VLRLERDRMPGAIIFDLDGVLMDYEQLWNEAKEALVREAGGRWREEAPTVMMGMSSSRRSTARRAAGSTSSRASRLSSASRPILVGLPADDPISHVSASARKSRRECGRWSAAVKQPVGAASSSAAMGSIGQPTRRRATERARQCTVVPMTRRRPRARLGARGVPDPRAEHVWKRVDGATERE
jgi:beta-phosphoglucomutase-like phosphatase (HAD superfamily)